MEHIFIASVLIAKGESYRTFPYDDKDGRVLQPLASAGKRTIGIGFNIDDTGISLGESAQILISRLLSLDIRLSQYDWYQVQNANRKAVLIDMAYNMGLASLLDFKNTIKFLGSGKYVDAGENIALSKYATQVGIRATRNIAIIKTGEVKF